MVKELKEFKHYFAEKLKNPDYAIAYFNQALMDEDKRIFLVALKNVIEANKQILELFFIMTSHIFST